MKRYHIGLDFGTNQTKVCIYNLERKVHEFFKFSNGTYFLPSRVALKGNHTLEYGSSISDQIIEEYHYFKIASAEDIEFHSETFPGQEIKDETFYKYNDYQRFTPEFLSVVYITYVLFQVKDKIKKDNFKPLHKDGLVGRLLDRKQIISEEISFTCQLGIPTEWSQKKNLRRKRKFENIIILSELLMRKYITLENFASTTSSILVNDVKELQMSSQTNSIESFENKLNDLGLSVYPETAAGLTFIIRTRQIKPGYYAAMDIGAGSTDVSFFKVLENQTIRYLASESYLMAANNVYQIYAGECQTIEQLKHAENRLHILLLKNNLGEDEQRSIDKALLTVHNKLEKLLRKLYARRVHPYKNNILQKYTDQSIIMYGGGAQLPLLSSGSFDLYNNGAALAFNLLTTIEKTSISRYAAIINILPEDGSWKTDFPMLVVALGLSFIKPDNAADWFNDTHYHAIDHSANLVPHPFNEDRFVYDVLLSKWSN